MRAEDMRTWGAARLAWEIRLTTGVLRRHDTRTLQPNPDPVLARMYRDYCERVGRPWLDVVQGGTP